MDPLVTVEEEALLLHRWSSLSSALQLPEDVSAATAAWLLERYTTDDRHYHDARHIVAMLEDFDRLRQEWNQPLAVEMAIFFHDAIYDASRSDNEARSAEELRKALTGEVPGALIDHACFMIEATKLHAATGDSDADLLIDLDMAVLTRDWPHYLLYARGVMQEYLPVFGETAYCRGRVDKFLTPTLAGEQVFLTPHFRPHTPLALANMRREKELLQDGSLEL